MEHRRAERDALATAMAKLKAHWDEPEAHESFVAFAAQVHALPAAARFYREMLAEAPERQAQVDAALQRITAQMLVTLELERSRRRKPPGSKWRSRLVLWAGFSIVFMLVGECMRR